MQTEFMMADRPTMAPPEPNAMTPSPIQPMRVRPRAKTLDLSAAETIKLIEKSIRIPPENPLKLTITPAVAEAMLVFNLNNRSKKPNEITLYANDMRAKDWRETGDNIKFSDIGLLRDGQNRLYACIEANTSFETSVVFGLPDNAFSKMDQGKKRSGGDVLQIAGFTDTNNLAAAIRWAYLFEFDRVKNRDTLTPEQTLVYARKRYIGLSEFVKVAGRVSQTSKQPKGLMAALLYTLDLKSPEKAAEWADAWERGLCGGKFRSIDLATKKIAEMKVLGGRVHDTIRAALLVKAWNMYVAGRGRKEDMVWTTEDDFPEIVKP